MGCIKENACEQVEDAILPPLSNDWFRKSALDMIRAELQKKELQTSDLEYLDNRILALESHEQRVDSVIRSKILLKKNKVYASSGGSLSLLEAVKDCLSRCQSFTRSLSGLRQLIISKCLHIYYLMYLYCRYMDAHDILKIICRLKDNLQFTREKLDSDDLQSAAISISSFKTLAIAQADLLNRHPTHFMLNMRHENDEQHVQLSKRIQLKLKNSLLECLDGSNMKNCFVTLNFFLKCLCHLENDTFLVNFLIMTFSDLLEKECQKCLVSFVKEEWKVSQHEDVFSMSMEDLIKHIDSEKCVDMFLMFFRVSLNAWTIYAEIVLWAIKQVESLEKKKNLKKNMKLNAKAKIVEERSLIVLQQLGCNMLSRDSNIFQTQLKALLIILRALRVDQVPFIFSKYFLIYVLLHRFVLEIYCIIEKSSDTWENVTGFHDMDLPLSFQNIPCFKPLDDSLKIACETQFHHFLDQQLNCFQEVVLKDAWETSSFIPDFHSAFKPLQQLKCLSLKSLALYDNALYPAYFSKQNPFHKFHATVAWKQQYYFFMENSETEKLEGDFNGMPQGLLNDNKQSTHLVKSYVVTESTKCITKIMIGLLKLLVLRQHLADKAIVAIFTCFDIFLYSISSIFSKKIPLQDLLHVICMSSNDVDCAQLEELHRVFLFQEKHQQLSIVLRFIAMVLKKYDIYDKKHTTGSFKNEESNDKNYHKKCYNIQPPHSSQHRVVSFQDAKQTVLRIVHEVFRASEFKRIALLKSPGALWGLAAIVTGVECCLTVLSCLTEIVHSVHEIGALFELLKAGSYPLQSWLYLREQAYKQLLHFLYWQAAQNLFDLKPLVFVIRSWKWENDHQQLGIEVGKLRMQLDDLQNKIACCGGGCISSCTQVELWKHIGYHAIHTCAYGVADNPQGFPYNHDTTNVSLASLGRLCQQFSTFLLVLSETIQKVYAFHIKEQNIKDDPSKVLLDTYYLDSYLGGHSLNGASAFMWCKLQTDYDIWMLKQLLHKTEYHSSLRKYYIEELELHVMTILNNTVDNACVQSDPLTLYALKNH